MAELRVAGDQAKAEATGKGTAVEYDGDTYTIAPSSQWDIDVMEAAEEGRVVTAVKLLLGAEQWQTFRAKHKTVGELEAFFEAIGELMGGNR